MALTYDGGEGCHWDEDQVNTDTVNERLIEVIVSILRAGVYIPVLPPRLMDVIDAPCHILLVFLIMIHSCPFYKVS